MQSMSEGTIEFFKLVSAAALANPFGAERDELDAKIASFLPKKYSVEMVPEAIAEHTAQLLNQCVPDGKFDKVSLNQQEREILSEAALFSFFHKYIVEFDKHIDLQNVSPGKNLPFACAPQIVNDLRRLPVGVAPAHVIALFFQMRRAYFFITRQVAGKSKPVVRLREQLWRSLFTHDLRFYLQTMHSRMESFSILLLGDTGVGKSQAAAALGKSAFIPFDLKSNFFEASFLDIHLAANISEFPETLVESELFGHRKGSFTGALDNYAGLLGCTHPNGMLFLDEIGELSLPVQVKLLRVLQDRNYSPVGSHEQRRFSGRLISATNANVFEKISRNEFRADLYYRLASDVIALPTLAERFQSDADEVFVLTHRVLRRLVGDSSEENARLVAAAVLQMVPKGHSWPGNLREFEQCVRSYLLHGRQVARAVEPRPVLEKNRGNEFPEAWHSLKWTADEMLGHYARSAYARLGSFEKVAQRLDMDWRTVKKWVTVEKGND